MIIAAGKNQDFAIKHIPSQYHEMHADPFEANLVIKPRPPLVFSKVFKTLKRVLKSPKYNFLVDQKSEKKMIFIHETGGIILYLFPVITSLLLQSANDMKL